MEKVFETYVKTTPQRLWEGITRGDMHREYNFGIGLKSDWQPGSRIESSGIIPVWEGEVIEADPPWRLVYSYRPLWIDPVQDKGTSRVTWEVQPLGEFCRVKITHGGLVEGSDPRLHNGWPVILGGLKQLLEREVETRAS